MSVFTVVLIKLIPLYIIIALGFLAGRFSNVSPESIAGLLIHIITPVVIIGYVADISITIANLTVPLLVFVMCAVMEGLFYWIGKRAFTDSTANLLALSAATGNIGYFGIPLYVLLFPGDGLGVYMLAFTGMLFFELTLGFYMIARGRFSIWQSLKQFIKLPPVYAVFAGMAISVMHLPIPDVVRGMIENFRSVYIVLGSLMIGLGMSRIRKFEIDRRYTLLTHVAKFAVWPIMVYGIISLDRYVLHMYNPVVYNCLIVFAVVPLMVDVVMFATQLHVKPEKAATGVFVSTVFALLYIPIVYGLFLK